MKIYVLLLLILPGLVVAAPRLDWDAPTERVDGDPLSDIYFMVFASDDGKVYTELSTVGASYMTLANSTPNGTECVHLRVSAIEVATDLMSDPSESVLYCPGTFYVKPDAPPMPVTGIRIVE